MKRPGILQYIGTAVLCALVLAGSYQIHTGFLIPFLIFVILAWLVYSIVVVRKHKFRWLAQAIKGAALLATLGVLLVAQADWTQTVKRQADLAAQKLLESQLVRGAYPKTLDEVGLNSQNLRNEWRIYYFNLDGKPVLFYSATSNPFDHYYYDFPSGQWEFHPG